MIPLLNELRTKKTPAPNKNKGGGNGNGNPNPITKPPEKPPGQ